jgi:hypothetical protein
MHNLVANEIFHMGLFPGSAAMKNLTYLKSYVILRSIRHAIEVAAVFLDMQYCTPQIKASKLARSM